jgi:HD-like signal output (HDOD) protein
MAFDKAILATLSDSENVAVKRLLEKGVKIPLQPRVLEELQQFVVRGETNLRALSRIISADPGIAAMLFKVVQSAAYHRYQPFSSIENILQAVGIKQTCNLVQAIALASALPSKSNQKAFEAFWARSQTLAQLAMLIADERISVCNIFPDQAYLAGVFHDCGVPVLMQRFSTYCKTMHLDEPGCWTDIAEEDARFNADHCVVGYLVGRHWKLPDFICDAIRYHHDINRLDNHAARTMVAILQLAIHIYSLDQRIDSTEWPSVCKEVLDELGMDEAALPEFIDVILENYHGSVC